MERKGVPTARARDPRLVGSQKESAYKRKCQKCNETTHWTYDCKKPWQYAHRDSRTAELKKRVVEGPNGKVQVIKKPEPVKEATDSSASSDSSSSDSSSSDSDSSSSSSSSSDEEVKKTKKRRKKSPKKVSKKKK